MAAKRKAVSPFQVGALGKTASKLHAYSTPKQPKNQPSPSAVREWIKTLIVWLGCWELLPAALAVLLLGGLRHD